MPQARVELALDYMPNWILSPTRLPTSVTEACKLEPLLKQCPVISFAILDLLTQYILPELDSNQQPFG